MGAACGCDGNSASTKEEVKQGEVGSLKSKSETPLGTGNAP